MSEEFEVVEVNQKLTIGNSDTSRIEITEHQPPDPEVVKVGKISCKFPFIFGELLLQASDPKRRNTRIVFVDREDPKLRGSANIELREIDDQPHLVIEGATNVRDGVPSRYSRTCVEGDLLVKDVENQNRIAQILFGNKFDATEDHAFSSIGYTEADGVRYLLLKGAWHGPSNDKKRRTRILGDLFVMDSESSTGHITAHKGNVIAEKGDIIAKDGNLKANDVLLNSSQELKQDISTLSKEEAYNLIEDLEPVKFAFKNDPSKTENIGFIAEDVPDIIADKDHKRVRYMEIISALTKVVKEQEKEINKLKQKFKI